MSPVPWQQELGTLPRARDGSVWEESGTSSSIGMSRVVLIPDISFWSQGHQLWDEECCFGNLPLWSKSQRC